MLLDGAKIIQSIEMVAARIPLLVASSPHVLPEKGSEPGATTLCHGKT